MPCKAFSFACSFVFFAMAGDSNRREYAGSILAIVLDGIVSYLQLFRQFAGQRQASIGVYLVERRCGAGDGDTNAMAAVEDLAGPTDVERDLGDVARR